MIVVRGVTYTSTDIRIWAKAKGKKIGDRGRIPTYIVQQFKQDKESVLPAPPKRKVVGNKVRPGGKRSPGFPKCPMHDVPMNFSTALGMWTCPEEGCKLRAWPKDGNTKPVIGQGKVTMVRENGRFYLRADNGVLMEVTNIATNVDVETTNSPGFPPLVHIHISCYMEN